MGLIKVCMNPLLVLFDGFDDFGGVRDNQVMFS
jgi:hypothetical protein